MAKAAEVKRFFQKPKKNNKGVHAKSKSSDIKTSKNYLKKNKGQGR